MSGSLTPDLSFLDRRTWVVLATLVMSLSLVSGLLLALNPKPHAPAVGMVLRILNPSPDDLDTLLAAADTSDPGHWRAIVVTHSGQAFGNAQTLGQIHQETGLDGLGFHFVIGNGDGAYDGEIQAGYRWAWQLPSPQFPDRITICLIGDGDHAAPTRSQKQQLVRLVRALQTRLHIVAGDVNLHRELADDVTSPGMLFNGAWFRDQLADVN